jgi:hypothetical protein
VTAWDGAQLNNSAPAKIVERIIFFPFLGEFADETAKEVVIELNHTALVLDSTARFAAMNIMFAHS